MKHNLTAVLIFSALIMGSAQAHHLWIEQDGKQATLYFGEYGDNLREVSPGRLDRFVKPTAQKVSSKGSEQLTAVKAANGFTLSSVAAKGESLLAEDAAYPITDRKDGDKTYRSLYVPAARFAADTARQEPKLTLDVVPTGKVEKGMVELQVFYKGKPLHKAKVAVVTASGWMQEISSAEDGKLMVAMPWAGSYVMEVKQADGAGERGGEKYDRASYVTSLTMVQEAGIAPLPAPVAAVPSKMN